MEKDTRFSFFAYPTDQFFLHEITDIYIGVSGNVKRNITLANLELEVNGRIVFPEWSNKSINLVENNILMPFYNSI